MAFNPHMGRYGAWIKGPLWAAAITPPAVAAYDGVQHVRGEVQRGLDTATATGLPLDQVPAGQWAQQLVHNPLPWAWRALTKSPKQPLESFADQQAWQAMKNKTWQGLHDWLPFKGEGISDYVGAAMRPGVFGLKQLAAQQGWMPNPATINPVQFSRDLFNALHTQAGAP
jgi:hypothetical protein